MSLKTETLFEDVRDVSSYEERNELLSEHVSLPDIYDELPTMERYCLLVARALGQDQIFGGDVETIAKQLVELEEAYAAHGGILGYQQSVLSLLNSEEVRAGKISPPKVEELTQETSAIRGYVLEAIERSDELAEMYPVGGAADRLNLTADDGKRLPAAKLGFMGKDLLTRLIEDVEAREYLAFLLFGKQVHTPIALMTSNENDNRSHIYELLERSDWYGRSRSSFTIFTQPLVPCVDKAGKWVVNSSLIRKPGGHGVIWLLAKEHGVFSSFEKDTFVLRQINNPISGTDFGLLAFIGKGLQEQRGFGFCGCPRRVGAKEGMNVVLDSSEGPVLTNVEYCEFEKLGVDTEGYYDSFPANTNILFADRQTVEASLDVEPFPGKVLNFSKKTVSARLETMMQNIADHIPLDRSYVTLGPREKTISSAKRQYVEGEGVLETPLGAMYTQLANAHDLLVTCLKSDAPMMPSHDDFEREGPSFFFSFHPALGPMYSLLEQKLSHLTIRKGANVILDIADLFLEKCEIREGLTIAADQITGHKEAGVRVYSHKVGSAYLRNVSCYDLSIHLEGTSRLIAEDVVFPRNASIRVPNGICMRVKQDGDTILYEEQSFDGAPLYAYTVDKSNHIVATLSR